MLLTAELDRLSATDWQPFFAQERAKPYFAELDAFVTAAAAEKTVYPAPENIFAAFRACPASSVRVVILGQDPYHEPEQAKGLCFAVKEGVALPPSLVNIYKELESDMGIPPAKSGDLSCRARQGVLLLNTVLTVRRGAANSHKGKGWEILTDEIIRKLNDKPEPVVFILWGANARSKKALITNPIHGIVESVHPSPLSAFGGFFGSRPFSKTNQFLMKNGIPPINWRVE